MLVEYILYFQNLFHKLLVMEEVEGADHGARFFGRGFVGDTPAQIDVAMDVAGGGTYKAYRFGDSMRSVLQLGGLFVSGVIQDLGAVAGVRVDDFDVRMEQDGVGNSEGVLSGVLEITRADEVLNVRGDVEVVQHGTQVRPVVEVILGGAEDALLQMDVQNFDPADFSAGSRLNQALQFGFNVFEYEPDMAVSVGAGDVSLRLGKEGLRVEGEAE